ncbi:hypothetical protein A11Q_653 [Pseudobdellovibrio exovorus JSS]|uniref:Uncharacterized protein n=1 Tax=Pseudobdellovibrio exovorus JSS TaxID=1184267 RepID=M4V6P0_9BACT|nr:hypothetical protein A11Q_653 [Pseudobdellovibrio exovorus JSS]
MSFFDFIQLKISSVWYIPQTVPNSLPDPVQAPMADYPDLIFLERSLIIFLFLILFIPYLKKHNSRHLEKKRKLTLKASTIVMASLVFLWMLRSNWIF